MGDNVIKIVSKSKTDTVNQELVDQLEVLMDRAKSGDIVGLAYAGVTMDGHGTMGWTDGGHDFALMGMVTVMANRFASEFD